jgi:hypothetical protein
VPAPTVTVHRPAGQGTIWMQARNTEPSATRPIHGTGRWRGRSNRLHRRLACRGRHDHCAWPVCGQLLVDKRRTSTAQFGGRTSTTRARHTKTTRPTRQKMCCALWTTACCAAHRVSSVARRRATSPPEPYTIRLPLSGARILVTGLKAPCVHRLWMSMWTGKVGVVQDGHIERDPGAIRLSPMVILTRSTERPTTTKRWKP